MPIEQVPVPPLPPERLMEVLLPNQAAEFDETIARGRALLGSRVIWNVNSTARGGGVAEILGSLIAYTRGAGLDARWVVIDGDPGFFRVTKRIHNMLHGDPGDGLGLGPADEHAYLATTERNAAELAPMVRPDDVVLLHDPQTAGLIAPLQKRGAHVIWRCHVGVDSADTEARAAWRFLLTHVGRAEAVVFSREAYVWEGLDPARVTLILPSIDALSAKNAELDRETLRAVLLAAGLQDGMFAAGPEFTRRDGTRARVERRAELSGSSPLPENAQAVIQVSRWDALKDPIGVLDGFCEGVARRTRAHLVLAGPSTAAVADDPEGATVLRQVIKRRAQSPAELAERIHLFSLPMEDSEENAVIVNALQRRAAVVVQKSLAEGFGLTVAEAMWKARPVVASRVGGIREQIVDGDSGLLVDPRDLSGFADALVGLLANPPQAERMGVRAREQVREHFLGPRHLRQYVDLFERLLSA